ncbi:rhodanese-like domain-containing protein [Vampirovibrio sp.]|uniref:rhodanese-like domain-containing protein n=1 Tax=Vampirovibrio sp. TaxID=2717857 RepID=UPI0035933C4D
MPSIVEPQAVQPQDIAAIIDVRAVDEFRQEHIPGSQNIPLNQLANALERLKSQPKVIVSCRSGNRASQACQQLEQWGLPNVQLLAGGLMGWKKAQRETQRMNTGFSIMQQVQIIVGVMVLSGLLYKPVAFLALIAGLGMLVAGFTNTCLMASLLGKLPWNRPAAQPNPEGNPSCNLPL